MKNANATPRSTVTFTVSWLRYGMVKRSKNYQKKNVSLSRASLHLFLAQAARARVISVKSTNDEHEAICFREITEHRNFKLFQRTTLTVKGGLAQLSSIRCDSNRSMHAHGLRTSRALFAESSWREIYLHNKIEGPLSLSLSLSFLYGRNLL